MPRAVGLAQAWGEIGLNGRTMLTSVTGASVLVCNQGTSTPISAPIYADASSGTTLTNPFTTDVTGTKQFYLDSPVVVTLIKTAAGFTFSNEDVVVDNPTVTPDLSGTYQAIATKDVANGYAGLDASGLHKPAQFWNGQERTAESFGFAPAGLAAAQATAWTAAKTWLTSNPGGAVVFAAGTTYVNMPVLSDIPDRATLRGGGHIGAKIKFANSLNTAYLITNHQSADGIEANGKFITLSGLWFDGNKANQASGGGGVRWTTPMPSSPATNDADPDGHCVVENCRFSNFKGDACSNTGGSEHRWINVYCDFCDGASFKPGFDSWIVVCTSSQSGLQGVDIGSPSVRVLGTKAFYAGNVTAASGAGLRVVSTRGGGVQLTGCEAQDNKAEGFKIDTCSLVSIVGIADSNSTSSSGTYPGVDVYNSRHCSINVICTGRQSSNTQTRAIQVRQTSRYNDIRIKHYAGAGTVADPILGWEATSCPNDVSINGCVPGYGGLSNQVYAASFTPTPCAGYTVSDTDFGGNCINLTLTGNITINAVSANQRFPGQTLRFILLQDATGGRTITWNALYHGMPAATTTLSTRTVADFIYDGSQYTCVGFRTGDAA